MPSTVPGGGHVAAERVDKLSALVELIFQGKDR